ncbi:GOLPH3/VPS74 family protein [Actinoplanes sp. CA-252034]|uniref:GOLPH3/VPS74 family protein n=1 Tax=Actinoplanes sp. CA-252034 TaxID=3239906 RepID=UPI003D977205
MTSPPKLAPADDFYLAAHDGIGGRPLLPDRVLGVGLAAALLGELMFWRRLRPDGDLLHLIDATPTGDPATSAVLQRMAGSPGPHGLGQWITHLSTGAAAELVERRLLAAGVLRQETRRRLLGPGTTSLVLADPKSPGEPAARIRTHLSYNESLDIADLMLAGLILATGLDAFVLDTCNPRDRARLSDQFRRKLPAALSHLVAHARAATADPVPVVAR